MNPLFIIFIGIPALEIFLLIKIGGMIGALNTVSLIFLTAIIGIYFAKLQGVQTLKSGMINLYQNKIPIYEMMSGVYCICGITINYTWFLYRYIGIFIINSFYNKIHIFINY